MITIISGSNRKDSDCLTFAKKYLEIFQAATKEEIKLLALENIPHDWFHPDMYEQQSPSLAALQDEYMIPANKFFFVISEYNGSFPGGLKLFIDACSVRAYKKTFKNKKAAMTGVATGRAGNLRGMDHLTAVLNHVGTIVMPSQIPISRISDLISNEKEVVDSVTLAVMEKQVKEFLEF